MPKNERAVEVGPAPVVEYLSKLQFRKKMIGGVDEYDVWRRIRELNDMYVKEMEEQRIRYEALINERDNLCRQAMVCIEKLRNGEDPDEKE